MEEQKSMFLEASKQQELRYAKLDEHISRLLESLEHRTLGCGTVDDELLAREAG